VQEDKRPPQTGEQPGELKRQKRRLEGCFSKLLFSVFVVLHFENNDFFYIKKILKIVTLFHRIHTYKFS